MIGYYLIIPAPTAPRITRCPCSLAFAGVERTPDTGHGGDAEEQRAALQSLAQLVAGRLGGMPGAQELGLLAATFHGRLKAWAASGRIRLAHGCKLSPWQLMLAVGGAALNIAAGEGQPVLCLATSLLVAYAGHMADADSRALVTDTLLAALQQPGLRKAVYEVPKAQHVICSSSEADFSSSERHASAYELATTALCRAALSFIYEPSGKEWFVLMVSRVSLLFTSAWRLCQYKSATCQMLPDAPCSLSLASSCTI